jgi:exonuclease SbcC
MRPVSLQVEAFSCFRDAQEALDFSALSLFAISGPTGAGKSSILDAITFALYGHVPRLGKQGISDVISLGRDRMTVRFEFAVGDRRFRIGRELRRKKATSVILEEITSGTERLLADKVREVDEQITALTGLRYETFIQTVLLPQGEFDRFLHSDPGERGKVLRELLKLDMYERMRVRAEQDSRQQHQQLTLMRERLDQDYADATPENLSSARTTLAEITDREALARTAAEAATKQLQEVQARFAQSTELAGRRARLEQLDSRRDRIAVDRERLEKARRAAPLIPRLDGLIAAEERVTIAQRELEEARAASQAAQSNVNRQLAARGRAQKEAAIVPALRTRIQALDELRGVLERRTQVAADIQSTKSAITAGTKDEKAAATEVQKTETATMLVVIARLSRSLPMRLEEVSFIGN